MPPLLSGPPPSPLLLPPSRLPHFGFSFDIPSLVVFSYRVKSASLGLGAQMSLVSLLLDR
eukprot:477796-Hanusia_phi.AAC.1